jgi:hypothetical protein
MLTSTPHSTVIEVQSPSERMTKPELELKGGASRELLIEISILIEEAVNIGLTALYCGWAIESTEKF